MSGIEPFNYSEVSSNLKQELSDDAEYIRRKQAEAQHSVIEAGIRLLAVKEKLPHGAFLPWVEAECGLSVRSVDDYLKIAREFGPNSHRGANLPIRAMRAIAAPSMPEEAKQEIYRKIDAGEKVSTAEIEAEKRKALDAIQQAKAAEDKADKAEQEKTDLLSQISEISQTANAEAQKKIEASEQRAAADIAALNCKIEALKLDAGANEAKIDAAVKAKAKAATAAEMAKIEGDLKELRRKQREAKTSTERLEESADRLRKNIGELQDRRNRINGADEEAKYLEDDLKEISTAINCIANTVQGLEHDHEGSVVKLALVVADQCQGFAVMLRSLQGEQKAIEMRVVN